MGFHDVSTKMPFKVDSTENLPSIHIKIFCYKISVPPL